MNAPLTGMMEGSGEEQIGTILMAAGRLRAEHKDRILRLQRDKGIRFGDAAVQLGLANERDIRYAMSRQFDYPYLQRGVSPVSTNVIAAYDPFCAQSEALRALRSQLVLRWLDPRAGRKALALVSPQPREGRSWMTANLGVSFSQMGLRTLLIDADLRHPTLHRLFGTDNRNGLSSLLLGRAAPDAVRRVPELRALSILPAGIVPPNPQELLARPRFGQLLAEYSSSFDVVLIDTPAGEGCADGVMVAVRADGALLVARSHRSRGAAVKRYAKRLVESGAGIAGSVMNEG